VITGHTRVLAVIGHPVAHSLSPALHNAWLQAAGIDAVYVALDNTSTDPATLVRAGLWGANITIPLKTRCTPDRLTTDAEATGAVNTLFWDGDTLVGDNTDVGGFRTSTEATIGPLSGRSCVVIGSGGAARAVVRGLQQAGASVRLTSRSPIEIGVDWQPLTSGATRDADVVVNTLPAAGRQAVEAQPLPRSGAWIDLNYWDPKPPRREAVLDAGLQWVDGHGMLRAQAALSFKRWTGCSPG
jgi:shikimate dehydrogenase